LKRMYLIIMVGIIALSVTGCLKTSTFADNRSVQNKVTVLSSAIPIVVIAKATPVAIKATILKPIATKKAVTKPATSGIKNGERGEKVLSFQKKLYEIGYNLGVDGIFGSGTETIVKNFQV